MSKNTLYFTAKFILLVLAQAIIFNNLVLFNVAVAFVFIYIIVSMPVTWTTNLSVTIGFLAGLATDVFSDTYGLNALCCTVLAFVRKPVFHLYVQHDENLSGQKLSQRTMGSADFMKFLLTMSLLYCILVFTIDSFTFFNIGRLVMCIIASTVFTFTVIYALDSVFTHRNEKRL